MVRRRSTVRFRKGAQVKRLIRTARTCSGAIPGAKWSGLLARSQSACCGTSSTGAKLPTSAASTAVLFCADPADGWPITPLHVYSRIPVAESSTRAYAISLALFFDWCAGTGLEWQRAPQVLGRFVHWLRYHDAGRAGPPDLSRPVRGERRVNCVLAAVREFFRHAASAGLAGPGTLRALFEVADERSLPAGPAARSSPTLGFGPGIGCAIRSAGSRRSATRTSWSCCGRAGTRGTGSSCWRCGGWAAAR
jgi:hypothetical protein